MAGEQRLPRCKLHQDTVLTVHPKRWGWICGRCRAAGQPTEQPYPFVPLPPVRQDRQTRLEQQVKPASCPGGVPSPTSNSGGQEQSKRSIVPAQKASDLTLVPASVSLKATVRGSSPWRRTPEFAG